MYIESIANSANATLEILKLATFDYAAFILLVILIFSLFFRRMTKGVSNRMYMLVILTVVASILFDIWSIHLDNSGAAGTASLFAAHTGYLITHNMTTPAYVLYVISLADTWHKLRKSKLQLTALILPFTTLVILLVVNLFTQCVFTVADGVYMRGELFWCLYAIAGYYMCLGLYYLYASRKVIKLSKIISISSIVPMMLVAILVQFFNPEISIEMFTCTLSLLFVSMTTQRPEDLIDAVTGLHNHNCYIEDIKRDFTNKKNISIILINIGNFASLNSMLGFDSIRDLLTRIADDLTTVERSVKGRVDIYYLEGGHFRLVFDEKYRTQAKFAAEMINTSLKNNISINGLALEIVPYICVLDCPEDISDANSVISFGSSFHESIEGTGTVVYGSELFKEQSYDLKSNINKIIDNALKNRKFQVYYQPIFSVEKQRFTTAEALLRLIDDDYGFIPPDVFITAAEKSGAIHKIGDFVLDEVCRFIASEQFRNLGLEYIEINLSVAQCMHGDLADKVLSTLKKYDITSDKINLEITETAASHAQNVMKTNLEKLSSAGVSFSLDDYGTGYSNMRRVIQLPLKIVKLDKSFVDEQNNPKMWVVLQNTIKMLKDMNMEIVVEGIETEVMSNQFADLKCDYIQGYYYSRPIPESDFIEFINKAHRNK